mmetsp:Transcript_13291/g.26094  ORF Transcript_13291/g.26094 Transcript_13291/m.26094 type:complete len:184 (+) Transcript_13291:52-603(+)
MHARGQKQLQESHKRQNHASGGSSVLKKNCRSWQSILDQLQKIDDKPTRTNSADSNVNAACEPTAAFTTEPGKLELGFPPAAVVLVPAPAGAAVLVPPGAAVPVPPGEAPTDVVVLAGASTVVVVAFFVVAISVTTGGVKLLTVKLTFEYDVLPSADVRKALKSAVAGGVTDAGTIPLGTVIV